MTEFLPFTTTVYSTRNRIEKKMFSRFWYLGVLILSGLKWSMKYGEDTVSSLMNVVGSLLFCMIHPRHSHVKHLWNPPEPMTIVQCMSDASSMALAGSESSSFSLMVYRLSSICINMKCKSFISSWSIIILHSCWAATPRDSYSSALCSSVAANWLYHPYTFNSANTTTALYLSRFFLSSGSPPQASSASCTTAGVTTLEWSLSISSHPYVTGTTLSTRYFKFNATRSTCLDVGASTLYPLFAGWQPSLSTGNCSDMSCSNKPQV